MGMLSEGSGSLVSNWRVNSHWSTTVDLKLDGLDRILPISLVQVETGQFDVTYEGQVLSVVIAAHEPDNCQLDARIDGKYIRSRVVVQNQQVNVFRSCGQ